jgi:RNA polymerase sigma-70 factor (ECF subfamily)
VDDLLQDTYLRLLRREMPELDGPSLKSYLYKTAHSALADHYRSRQREVRWQEEGASMSRSEFADGKAVDLEDSAALGSLELPADMQLVFDTLKPRQQTLLWLAYVEGFKHDEIAEVIGLEVNSVKVLLSRARTALAAKLSEHDLLPNAARGMQR